MYMVYYKNNNCNNIKNINGESHLIIIDLKKEGSFSETSVIKYYKGKTFPINAFLLEVVSYLFLDCLKSNPEL